MEKKDFKIISCPSCGQKLRVPVPIPPGECKCLNCENRFSASEIDFEQESREALKNAIKIASESLSGKCKIYLNKKNRSLVELNRSTKINSNIETWKLMEVASLLSIISRAENIITKEIYNVLGVTGPIEFIENGRPSFLWAQPLINKSSSGFKARPDLVVTSTSDGITDENVLRVIECKCRKKFGASDIRAEFGKAYDFKVTSYFIWTFKKISENSISCAKQLGIDIKSFGFDTDKHQGFIDKPATIIEYISNTLEQSRKEKSFAKKIINSGEQTQKKLRLLS